MLIRLKENEGTKKTSCKIKYFDTFTIHIHAVSLEFLFGNAIETILMCLESINKERL